MRSVLLFLLGGVLVWWLWTSIGGNASVASADGGVPGAMLPPERSAPELPAPLTAPNAEEAAKPEVSKPAENSSAPALPPVRSVPPPPVEAPTVAHEPPPRAGSSRAVELELARSLVASPQDFMATVQARSDLSASARSFALALARALDGSGNEARKLLDTLDQGSDVSAKEREFLQRAIDQPLNVNELTVISAAAGKPLVHAALLVLQARAAEAAVAAGRTEDAARTYSDLVRGSLNAAWGTDSAVLHRWTAALAENQRKFRWNRGGRWPSVSIQAVEGDSLIALRKRVLKDHPDLLVCTGELERANEIKGSMLQPGQTLRVPTDRPWVLVDLDAHWAFYFFGEEIAASWEVGVGKEGGTRPGAYTVGDKKEEPMWFRQGQAPVPYGDPQNPLGTRWIAWLGPDGKGTGLGFHGTNAPESIGKDQSQGCIRMLNADVEQLFEILPKGAQVIVQP